jgi:hypothetical protein
MTAARLKRIALHLFIVAYIALTLDAFSYTMFRRWSGLLPWSIVRYAYALMAPYQGLRMTNTDMVAEGKRRDGIWETINLDPYYPSYSLGQKNVRQEMLFVKWSGIFWNDEGLRQRQFTKLARMLREREGWRGRHYDAVRLTWEEWPPSPAGYDFLRTEPFITRVPVAAHP